MSTLTATKPKLGFAGIVWIGKNRLIAIKNKGAAHIKAAVDPDPAAIQALSQSVENLHYCNTFEDLLKEDINGIIIATPSALHARQAIAALNTGKAVFCQKPLGRNEQETAEVIHAARRQNLLLEVDFSYRNTQAAKQVRKVVRSGELGKIYAVDLIFHNAYGPDKTWYYDGSLSGGGCLMDLGIHLIDLLFWILDETKIGRPVCQLFHQARPLQNRRQTEDYAAAQFRVNNDTTVQLACSWNLPVGKDAVIKAAFYGENGGAVFRNVEGSFYDFAAEKHTGTSTEILAEPPDDWSGKRAVEWVHKLAESNTFDPEAETYINTAYALDLLYKNCP
jgi:predicted dehydrogenase